MKVKRKEKKGPDSEDETDKAYKAKVAAGTYTISTPIPSLYLIVSLIQQPLTAKKADKDMATATMGKKGPLNTGTQGIKKSGKK